MQEAAESPFDGEIALELVSDDGEGVQAYVVSSSEPGDIAEDCVDHFIGSHERVSCYVFRDDVTFEAAGAPSSFGEAMENVCWDAYLSQSGDNSAGEDSNPKFDPDICSNPTPSPTPSS